MMVVSCSKLLPVVQGVLSSSHLSTEFMTAFDEGNVIVTNTKGSICDYESVDELIQQSQLLLP